MRELLDISRFRLLVIYQGFARLLFGPSPTEIYNNLMRNKYYIDIDVDLPSDQDIDVIEEQLVERLKNASPLDLEQYSHDHDEQQGNLLLSIAIFNRYWKNVVFKNLETGLTYGPKNILVAEIPDPKFNAFCIKAAGGYLVVFNRGLALFITRTVKLLLGCTRLRFPNMVAEATISKQVASSSLKTEIAELMLNQRHFLPLPLRSEFHVRIYPVLINFIESWVCSHELGHCMANSSSNFSIQSEYDADRIGYGIYINIDSPLYPDTRSDTLIGGMHFAAPHLFFLISEACEKHKPNLQRSHPSSANRSELLMQLSRQYSKEQIEIGNLFIAQLRDLLDLGGKDGSSLHK
jgi:hypothetical protein